MEQQIFTITVRRPLTRMERLRLRRRRNWEIARTALWILAAAAMVVAALIYGERHRPQVPPAWRRMESGPCA